MTNKLIFKIFFKIFDDQLRNFKKIVAEIVQNNTSFCGMFSTHDKLGPLFYDYYFSESSLKGSIILRFKTNDSAFFIVKNFVSSETYEQLQSQIEFEEFTILGECSNEIKRFLNENKPKNININFKNFSSV